MPFNDPKVVAAIEEFGWFARNDTYVVGGAGAVATTDFRARPARRARRPPSWTPSTASTTKSAA
jgi:alpha-glucoside transport system substrate-binding protein